jgi:threonine/homoserine/homoserine lactone efflux protein
MIALSNFLVSFFFSFIGTIPPGTLNLSILQLGVENKLAMAWRLALAAAIVEYPYAWIAVKFERLITASPLILENIQLITAIVMTLLGIFSLWSARRPSKFSKKFYSSGFRRGLVLGLLNPLALPFWLGTTAYLKGQRWIDLTSDVKLHAYLLGVSLGALALLMLLAYLAKRIVINVHDNVLLKVIPGLILLILGVYAFVQYML